MLSKALAFSLLHLEARGLKSSKEGRQIFWSFFGGIRKYSGQYIIKLVLLWNAQGIVTTGLNNSEIARAFDKSDQTYSLVLSLGQYTGYKVLFGMKDD
jgi:hypothetical protein